MSSVQPGQVAAGIFAAKPGTNAARVSPVESQSCSNGHLRSGEGAPSATADSHTAPEVKKWLGHKDPAPLAFALHPDLQLMAQPD